MKQRNTEKGSALIIIFIGIALFASLTYVVAQMFRGTSASNMTKEKSQLSSSEILEFARGIRGGVQELRVSNNCTENDLSFEATGLTGYAHSPAAPASCKIFSTSGASLTYITPQEEWLDTSKEASATYGNYAFVRQFSVSSVGTAESDLAIVLNYVRKDVCMAINDHLGIDNPSDMPPKNSGTFHSTELFIGSFDSTSDVVNAAGMSGASAGCVQSADGSNNVFYQILQPR